MKNNKHKNFIWYVMLGSYHVATGMTERDVESYKERGFEVVKVNY